jgi:hypothetical protein
MFNRIKVDVIHVFFKIVVIPNLMFPEATLPDGLFAMFVFRLIHPCLIVQLRFVLLCKFRFDQTPALRIIGIIFRQRPDAMHVIRQQHPRFDAKRIVLPHLCDGVTQGMAVFRLDKEFLPLICYHGKKVSCTFGIGAAVVRHIFSSPFIMGRAGIARHRVDSMRWDHRS